ncbi:MAG: YcxB family protein [Chthoniobacter sp.]|nr:YcxB family protein [Chthoniobacter sp.]
MNSSVHLSFRYAESDYVRALRAHFASRLRLRLDVAVVIILVGLGAYLWQSPVTRALGIGCAAVGLLFALLLVAAFTVIPPLLFRREPKFRDDYSLTFSAEGVHFRTAHIDSQLQWSLYRQALVAAHSYVLYYGSNQFTVIPRRVFQSPEQEQAFEQLLIEHVPKIVRQGG